MEDNTKILQGDDLMSFLKTDEPKKEVNTLEDLFPNEEKIEVEKEVVPISTESEKPPTEIIPPVEPVAEKKTTKYKEAIETLLETGDWEDAYVSIGEEEVKLSELEDVDQELFLQIKQAKDEEKKTKLESTYISIDGIDERTKKLIEISKNNGDLTELIRIQSQIVNPIEQIEREGTEESYIYLVASKMQAENYDPEYIDLKIKKFISEGTLDLEAQKVIDEVKTNYQKYVDNQLEEAKNKKLQEEQDRKNFRKTLSENLKEYKLKDADYKNLLETASRFDENGVTEADKLFNSIKKEDPKRYLELVMYAKSPQIFEDIKLTPIKNKSTIEVTKKVLNLKPIASVVKEPQNSESLLDKVFKNQTLK